MNEQTRIHAWQTVARYKENSDGSGTLTKSPDFGGRAVKAMAEEDWREFHQDLVAAMSYDPSTGHFIWKKTGARKGNVNREYRRLNFGMRRFYEHQLAWFYVHGAWPHLEIDHINGNGHDNRIENIRCVTRRGNNGNMPQHRAGKPVGVSFKEKQTKRPWAAFYTVQRRTICIGCFTSKEEAIQARKSKLEELSLA